MKVSALFWLLAMACSSPMGKAHGRHLDENETYNEDGLIPDQYIVLFHSSVTSVENKVTGLVKEHGNLNSTQVLWQYKNAFQGVALSFVNPQLLQALESDPDVKSVEQDALLTLDAVETKYHQKHPPNWGLDRIDPIPFVAHQSQLDGTYHFDQTGENVYVLVFDTGVRWEHAEFDSDDGKHSKVTCGFDAFHMHQHNADWEPHGCYDGNGHGTYVSGIIAGNIFGVAKGSGIVSIKVFDDVGIGSIGSAIAGLDYAYGHVQSLKFSEKDELFVANLSFGSSRKVQAFEDVVSSLIKLGVPVVSSAGNDSLFACGQVPALVPEVIAVGASTFDDQMALFSNFGDCMDLFAPGASITSSWIGDNTDSVTLSGTSAAAAHTSGVIALMLEKFPGMSPEEVKKSLLLHAEVGSIDWVPENTDTRNLLLNMGGLVLFPDD